MAQTDEIKTSWVTKWDKREKPWGYEMVWSSFMSGHGKLLFLKKGHRTSLKFNTRKSESLLILSGSVTAHFGDELSIEHPVAHPRRASSWNDFKCSVWMSVQTRGH